MTPSEFERYFKKDIGACLNWEQFMLNAWAIEERLFCTKKDANNIYTPWYADSFGSIRVYSDSDAKAQSIEDVSKNDGLILHHRVQQTAPGELISIAPAYRLSSSEILLLDGNHRAVSNRIANTSAGIMAIIINGPLSENILPDLKHWS